MSYISRVARKPTTWHMRKASTGNLRSPRRLMQADTFRFPEKLCCRNHYYIPLSPSRREMSGRYRCVGCARWSGRYFMQMSHCWFSWDAAQLCWRFTISSSENLKTNYYVTFKVYVVTTIGTVSLRWFKWVVSAGYFLFNITKYTYFVY